MRFKPVIVLIFIINGSLCGQGAEKQEKLNYDKLAIGISPSSVFNNIKAIQFSIDVGLTNNFRFSTEIGYIYYSINSNYTKGFRFRPTLEILAFANEEMGVQFGVFGLMRNFDEAKRGTVRHRSERYYEYIPYNKSKNLSGAGMAISLLFQLRNKFKVEIGGGLGAGNLKIVNDDDYDFSQEWFGFFSNDNSGEYSLPIIFININFSYPIFE